jgi:hypothetical protein
MLLILLLNTATSAMAMDIRISGNQLIMSGHIAGDEIVRLRDLLPANPQIDTVVLRDSLGGDVWTAMRLGETIAERGFRTAVSGHCMSACALIFLGGRERHFADGSPGSRTQVGLHTPVHSSSGGRSWPPPGATFHGEQRHVMLHWIFDRIGPRADRTLIERAIVNDHPQGMMYFFDHIRLKRADGMSVFQCKGPEKTKIADCEAIGGTNAVQAGLVTNESILALNP